MEKYIQKYDTEGAKQFFSLMIGTYGGKYEGGLSAQQIDEGIDLINSHINQLKPNQKKVLELRVLSKVLGKKPLDLKETSELLGITKREIRDLENISIVNLRNGVESPLKNFINANSKVKESRTYFTI